MSGQAPFAHLKELGDPRLLVEMEQQAERMLELAS